MKRSPRARRRWTKIRVLEGLGEALLSQRQVFSRRFRGACMQISAGRRDGGMAKRPLNQMNRGSPINRVAGMGMTEPMAGDGLVNSSSFRGSADDSPGLACRQGSAPSTHEDRPIIGRTVSQVLKRLPYRFGQEDRSRLVPLSEDGDLSGSAVAVRTVLPSETAKLTDA